MNSVQLVLAFDCFGTVFDVSNISRKEVKAYVEHVRKPSKVWTPHQFGDAWYRLFAHADSAIGIAMLQMRGVLCWAFSNGDRKLIEYLSWRNGIAWDNIVDLSIVEAYKPHAKAYQYLQELAGDSPLAIVTANPTFGDIEGAASIGARSYVIRHGKPETITQLAESI